MKNTKGATAALRPRICHAFQSSASRLPHSRISRLPAEKAAPHGQPSRATAAAGSTHLSAARAAAVPPGKNSRTRTTASHHRPAPQRTCSSHSFHAADSRSAGQAPRIIHTCRTSTARCSHRSAARAQDRPTRCAAPCYKPSATAHHRSRFHSRSQAPDPATHRTTGVSATGIQSPSHASHSGPHPTRTGSSCDHTSRHASTFSARSAESPQPRRCSHRDARRSREKSRR